MREPPHTVGVTLTPRRSRTAPAKAATVLGIGGAAALVAGALPFATLPSLVALLLPVPIVLVAHWAARRLVRAGRMAGAALLVSLGALVIMAPLAIQASTLAWRGQRVEATVVRTADTRLADLAVRSAYLADEDGRPIAGRLPVFDDGLGVGDRIPVVVAAGHWVDPGPVVQVEALGPLWSAVGGAFGLTALASLWSAYSRPRRLPLIRVGRTRVLRARSRYQ